MPFIGSSDCAEFASGVEEGEALNAFCHWVLTFRRHLPNILSDEKMKRMRMNHLAQWEKLDLLSMNVHYAEGRVEYSDITVDGKLTAKTMFDLGGSWSTGELGTVLEGVVIDVRKSKFKFLKRTKIQSHGVLGFEFNITRAENSSWTLQSGDRKFVPGYKGRIWLDQDTYELVQFERVSTEVDPKFPIQSVATLTKYSNVSLGDKTDFVLPVSSQSITCLIQIAKDVYANCLKNELTFENWRKFGAEHRITTDIPKEPN